MRYSMPPSTSGPGCWPFKPEALGSNPTGGIARIVQWREQGTVDPQAGVQFSVRA